ncbi:MAG: xanthine phosphoribosyltransferase [Bacteroidaceae bacterium]|nr:xanthine phosphoribosyltransferase [Bacteroidaceae bacterium]
MQQLKERILHDGRCLPGGVLKVDGFVNHQMDAQLMHDMAAELVRRFHGVPVDKVFTIEASGIAPAIMVGWLLQCPVVFAKKKRPSTMHQPPLEARIRSFTKGVDTSIYVSREFLRRGERILFVDDFLANGSAARGILDLVCQAQARLVGMGFIIEKAFQHGGDALRREGIRVESLAVIDSLDDGIIRLRP